MIVHTYLIFTIYKVVLSSLSTLSKLIFTDYMVGNILSVFVLTVESEICVNESLQFLVHCHD